jgi:hypothetical protein
MSSKVIGSSGKKPSPLVRHLRSGQIYRRSELSNYSTAIDREIAQLLAAGCLGKLAQGLYYVPIKSVFGPLPPSIEESIAAFLNTRNFLLFSPSLYNAVGLGTIQFYNSIWIYNHKRHGIFKVGNLEYDFQIKRRFPKKITTEFLFVDMINNIDELAEDRNTVLTKAHERVKTMDMPKLRHAIKQYANATARKKLNEWINS